MYSIQQHVDDDIEIIIEIQLKCNKYNAYIYFMN